MPKLRKAYFFARNKRQRTVLDFFGLQFVIVGYLVYLFPYIETKTQLVKRCDILEIAL